MKITDVYMFNGDKQVRHTMKQFLEMRQNDPPIRALKFIPIDNRMYEATPEQFREWKREQNRRAYIKRHAPAYIEVSYDARMREDGMPACESIAGELEDVAETAATKVMLESLQAALMQLTAEDRQLVHAIYFEGMTEREYAKQAGISQPAIHKRLTKVLAKTKKICVFKILGYQYLLFQRTRSERVQSPLPLPEN